MSARGFQTRGFHTRGFFQEDTPPPATTTLLQMLNYMRYSGSTFTLILAILL